MSSNITASNAFMDTHNITVEPGADFENWIEVVKQKLKERENKIMFARITALQAIIATECKSFENINSLNSCTQQIRVPNNHKIIHNAMVTHCLDKLHLTLSLWNGINMRKTKKTPSTFHQYFTIAKTWFNQKTKAILAPDLFIKLFVSLEQFTSNAAAEYFNQRCHSLQRLYAKQLLFRILCGVFYGEFEYEGYKPQPLIACSILKDSEPMKQYLLTLHPTLDIDSLIQQKTLNAKELLHALHRQLLQLTNQYHQQFQDEFKALWNDVAVTPHSSTSSTPTSVFYDDQKSSVYPQTHHLATQETVCNTRFSEVRPPTIQTTYTAPNNNAFDPQLSPIYRQHMPVHQIHIPPRNNGNYNHNAFIAGPNQPIQQTVISTETETPLIQDHLFDDGSVAVDMDSVAFEPFGLSSPYPMLPPFDTMNDDLMNDDLMNDWNSYDCYNGNHCMSQSVSTQRFNPMNSNNNNCNYI